VVIQTKQHLAALVPSGPALVLNLLRWGDEIRSWEKLSFPPEGTEETGITDKELKMAEQLVMDMSGKWHPEAFRDSFKEEIMKLVHEKVETGDIQTVAQPEESEATPGGAQILDLTELLQRSLKKSGDKEDSGKAPRKKPAKAADADDVPATTKGAHKRRA
jgi:DNA end-binding protein Ku